MPLHRDPEPPTGALKIDPSDPVVVVEGPAEVTIAKAGEPHTYQFGSGLSSGEIVSTSLAQGNLSDVTPPDIQSFLILAINQIEKFSRESKGKKTVDEHSFKINFGIISYEYKRKVEKD